MSEPEVSLAQQYSKLPKEQYDAIIDSMTPKQQRALQYDWNWWARPKQLKCFKEQDWSTFLYLCGRGFGKLLDKSLPINTLNGWKSLGEVKVGDVVFDEQGNPTTVLKIFDDVPKKAYRLYFNDGTYIDSCDEHQWVTWTARDRKQYRRNNKASLYPKNWVQYEPKQLRNVKFSREQYFSASKDLAVMSVSQAAKKNKITYNTAKKIADGHFNNALEVFGTVKTTGDIVKSLTYGNREDANHCIFNAQPLNYPKAALSISPYVLGAWLGDGDSSGGGMTQDHLSQDKAFLIEEVISEGFSVSNKEDTKSFYIKGLVTLLRGLGLYKNKHIPQQYLRSSIEQRIALLQGLMDTDGSVNPRGTSCEFTQSNEKLAKQVYELIVSLGMKATISERIPINTVTGIKGKKNWRITFCPTIQVFRLPRKANKLKFGGNQYSKRFHRMIVKAEEITPVPMRCLTVDSPSSVFLVGEQMIPTHNTRTGTEWVKHIAETRPGSYIAVVGPTTQSVNRTLVEGETGLMNICDPNTVHYQRTKAQIRWKNGSVAMLYSAEKPDRLRGPNHHYALADEIVAWKNPETWDMLKFTLRIGANPQTLVTTTPKPTDLVLKIIGGENNVANVNAHDYIRFKKTVIVRGTTFENTALSQSALDDYLDLYENTVMGEQELYAKLLINIQGALFKKEWIKHYGLYEDYMESDVVRREPNYVRTIVAVDPATTNTSRSDQTAICVASKGDDGRYYIRYCEGHQKTPDGWAQEVVKVYKKFNADKIVCETNNGGDMVENTIRQVKSFVSNNKTYAVDAYTIPIEKIHAKKGKFLRAEEVALLYEQGRVTHIHTFGELESQMIVFKGEPNGADDLVDAMVYAVKDLAGVRMIDHIQPQVIGGGLVSDRIHLL